MSRRAKDDAITLAMAEVSTAEQRVSKAQEAMRAFRDRSGMLDRLVRRRTARYR